MDEQVVKYREAKIMEPIYRMYKVIEEEDVLKAQTLMSVTMQYIIEHYSGKPLRPADVQQILRAVLLREDDGKYYALYVHNELQVKVAEWLTLLCVDLPVTLEQLGDMVNRFADELNGQDYTLPHRTTRVVVRWTSHSVRLCFCRQCGSVVRSP